MSTAGEEDKDPSGYSEPTSVNGAKLCNELCPEMVSDSCDINIASDSVDDAENFVKSDILVNNSLIDEDGTIVNNCDSEEILRTPIEDGCGTLDLKVGDISEPKEEATDVSDGLKEPFERVHLVLTPEQLSMLTKEELIERWNCQEKYIDSLKTELNATLQEVEEIKKIRLNDEKLKSQLTELQRKEQYHIMRLATKEHEIQELGAQIEELKNMTAGGGSLKHSLLDPAVNLLFERMKRDFDSTKTKMEETQNELAAWKFTPDSNTGKQLMAKCRLLIKENEELGKMISSGKLAKLEGDLVLQRNFSEELKKSQSELEEFLQEMDEDTEGMQGTILYLQSQLRQSKEKISHLTSQLSQSQGVGNFNPGSSSEGHEYPEQSPESGLDPPMEDSFPEEERTLVEESNSPYKSNGDLSDHTFSVGCKRTQSVLEEAEPQVGGDNPPKRTRAEWTADPGESGCSVVENGLSVECGQ